MGAEVASTAMPQKLAEIRVYPGRDAAFTLYDDDGTTHAYRKGQGTSATLRWDESARRLTALARLPTGQDPQPLVRIAGAAR
jgi:alpha-D-xyloside xylohydrolase